MLMMLMTLMMLMMMMMMMMMMMSTVELIVVTRLVLSGLWFRNAKWYNRNRTIQ